MQRVPASEKQGRRQTSTVLVRVIEEERRQTEGPKRADLRMDTYRASGPGGQHRNKTDSAVRLTHLPTGLVVTATESRSQHENRRVAHERMRTALEDRARDAAASMANDQRREAADEHRTFVWTQWRDEVKTPGGRKARMGAALKGRLGPLVQ